MILSQYGLQPLCLHKWIYSMTLAPHFFLTSKNNHLMISLFNHFFILVFSHDSLFSRGRRVGSDQCQNNLLAIERSTLWPPSITRFLKEWGLCSDQCQDNPILIEHSTMYTPFLLVFTDMGVGFWPMSG